MSRQVQRPKPAPYTRRALPPTPPSRPTVAELYLEPDRPMARISAVGVEEERAAIGPIAGRDIDTMQLSLDGRTARYTLLPRRSS